MRMEKFDYLMTRFFSETKRLAVPLGIGLTITSLILLLSGFLTPVALGIFGNIMLALIISAGTFLAGRTIMGIINLPKKIFNKPIDTRHEMIGQLLFMMASGAVFITLVALSATGVLAPLAFNAAGAVFTSIGAGLSATLLFHEAITTINNAFYALLLMGKRLITATHSSRAAYISPTDEELMAYTAYPVVTSKSKPKDPPPTNVNLNRLVSDFEIDEEEANLPLPPLPTTSTNMNMSGGQQ